MKPSTQPNLPQAAISAALLSAANPPETEMAPFYADPDFAMEEEGAQAEVEAWWPIMQAIKNAPQTVAALQEQAGKHHIKLSKVKRLYYFWLENEEHFSALIDRRKYPDPADAALPSAFKQFLCSLYDANQRKNAGKRAIDTLMARLAAWERDPFNESLKIPGYHDGPPKRSRFTGLPRGWSKSNLSRVIAKGENAFTRALRKQGPKAASIYLPKVHTTRADMYYGEVLYFDDDLLDTYTNLTGINSKAMRAGAFTCAEALSASIIERGYKPELEKKDERGAIIGTRSLNQDDFFWFVMWILTTHGYSPRGTGLVFEWGTANVDKRDIAKYEDHFDTLIRRITNNKVYVIRSGKFHDPAFKGMLFESKSTGNFRFKAPLESWFGLFRNHAAMLPGATGRNPAEAPEENYGLIGYNDRALKLIESLPRERFLKLRRPVLEWEDLLWASRIITEIIDRRTDHELEGWDKLGFRKQKYRLDLSSDAWMSEEAYLSLPESVRTVYNHIVCQNGYFRSEKMSPRDVREMLQGGMSKLPTFVVPQLAPPRMWKPVTVQNNLEIIINARNDEEYADSEDLIYIGKVRTAHGHEVNLERGKKYFRLLNCFNPDTLWIAEANGSERGRFIGTAIRVQTCGKFDHESVLEQLGAVNHVKSVESAEVRARTVAAAVSQRLEMREHNRAVIAGEPVTQQEKIQAAKEKNLADLAENALDEIGY